MARTYADVPARHETAGGGKEEEERQERREEALLGTARSLWGLPSFGGEAVDPVVGLDAGEVRERLADAVLEALDAVLAPPLGR